MFGGKRERGGGGKGKRRGRKRRKAEKRLAKLPMGSREVEGEVVERGRGIKHRKGRDTVR